MTYEIRIETGHAFDSKFQLRDTWNGRVVFIEANGKATDAMHGDTEWKTDDGKKRVRAKLNEYRRRLERHLKTTGKRWEVERRAELEAKHRKDKAAAEARRRVMHAAPELLDALQELLAELQSFADDVAFSPAKIRKAEAAISKALTVPPDNKP